MAERRRAPQAGPGAVPLFEMHGFSLKCMAERRRQQIAPDSAAADSQNAYFQPDGNLVALGVHPC